MFIVGLTGGSGTGKSTVARVFEEYGFAVIDADKAYASLVKAGQPCLLEIEKAFKGVVLQNGELNRKALSEIVFSDPQKLKQLGEITHPFVLELLEHKIKLLEQKGFEIVVVDAAALFESGFDSRCDMVVAVTAPKDARISRIISRDGISRELAEKRIESQKTDGFYTRSSLVICNDGDLLSLEMKARDVAEKILRRWESIDGKKKG
jgi:dephospho-CoA kinase